MPEYVFVEKNSKPDDRLMSEKIGKTFQYLQEIRKFIKENFGTTTEEWKFYGQKYGWQLKTFLKKRNLFFIIPFESFFKIVFIFGDRAVEQIKKSDIADNLKNEVINAKKYAEGRGLSIEVYNDSHISDIKELIDIKISN